MAVGLPYVLLTYEIDHPGLSVVLVLPVTLALITLGWSGAIGAALALTSPSKTWRKETQQELARVVEMQLAFVTTFASALGKSETWQGLWAFFVSIVLITFITVVGWIAPTELRRIPDLRHTPVVDPVLSRVIGVFGAFFFVKFVASLLGSARSGDGMLLRVEVVASAVAAVWLARQSANVPTFVASQFHPGDARLCVTGALYFVFIFVFVKAVLDALWQGRDPTALILDPVRALLGRGSRSSDND